MAENLETTIREAAEQAEQVTVDGTTTKSRSLSELIEADKHLRKQNAASSSKSPLRVTQIVPGGAA